MKNIICVEVSLPEPHEPVVVYFDNPDVKPEIDHLEYDSKTRLANFANNSDGSVKYWCSIPSHPGPQNIFIHDIGSPIFKAGAFRGDNN